MVGGPVAGHYRQRSRGVLPGAQAAHYVESGVSRSTRGDWQRSTAPRRSAGHTPEGSGMRMRSGSRHLSDGGVELRQVAKEEQFERLMTALDRKLGTWQSAAEPAWNVSRGTGGH